MKTPEFDVNPLIDLLVDTMDVNGNNTISKTELQKFEKMTDSAALASLVKTLDGKEGAKTADEYNLDAVSAYLKQHYNVSLDSQGNAALSATDLPVTQNKSRSLE